MENKNLAVSVFTNEEFGEVRTVVKGEEVWFVGKDVARALGYESPRAAVSKKVDEEDRGVAKMETPSGTQNMTIINESGMYSLVLSSKLESAKKFKRWVTSEVLPTIRKHGAYISENADVEYVNNELKFSEKRTIKTFAECKSIDEAEKLYEEFKAYIDKEYKNDSKTRIARYKSVEKGLNKLHKNLAQENDNNIGKCHSVKVLLVQVLTDRTTLEKRVSGGIRADLKKKLQSVSQTTIQ